MRLITNVIELRVPDSSVRADRAGVMARWMGERLGVEKEMLDPLALAARIHEIGKIIMPDEVLGLPVRELTRSQRETLDQFPLFGQMLVGQIPQLRDIGPFIRHQLENHDGTGLPDHLRGTQIPLPSRILRAVNIVEEQATGSTPEAVVDGLQKARGTILDPAVVQCAAEYVTTLSDPSWMLGKKQVPVSMMREGMVIAADVCTAKGTKLVPRDTRLTRSQIAWIQSYHLTDPILQGVYVYET